VSSEHLLPGSDARLWELIAARAEAGADVAAIDARIWELFGEEWAVMFTDLAGFSRNVVEFGITHFLQVIYQKRQLLLPICERHCGFLVKAEADSFLLLFRKASSALDCAIAMQRACAQHNARRIAEEHIMLCVGIGWGQILRVGEIDCWGREVNAAAKLGEDTAQADEILVTEAARHAIGDRPGLTFTDLHLPVGGSPKNFRVTWTPPDR
jgi:class 3 adenylate cyclase